MRYFLILLLFFINTLAFDYEKNINYKRFDAEELNKISDIQLEIEKLDHPEKKSNVELVDSLKQERDRYVHIFINKFINHEYKSFDADSIEHEGEKIEELQDEKLDADIYIKKVTDDMRIKSNQLNVAFKNLINDSVDVLNNYEKNSVLQSVFLAFQNNMTMNTRVYDRVYHDILQTNKGTNKTANEEWFITAYYRLQDQIRVYNVVFDYMQKYADNIAKTETLINTLDLGELIKYINKKFAFDETNILLKRYLNATVGEIVAIFIIIIGVFLLYLIIFITITKGVKHFYKNDEQRKQKIKIARRYFNQSLHYPLRLLLTIFAIDVIQRIIYYGANNIKTIEFIHILYVLIFIWMSFKLIDNYVLTYSNGFLEKFPQMRAEVINFVLTLAKIIILLTALVIILDNMDVNVTGLLASIGIGGIALALAAKTSLENMFSSVSIILDDMFSQGDWIVTDKGQGTVVEIGLRSTKVRTFDNAMIYYPNSYLASTDVKNFSKRKLGRRIKMDIGVTYSSNMDDVLQAVNDIRDMLIAHDDIADSDTEMDRTSMQSRSRIEKLEDLYGISKTLLVYLDSYGDSSINILVYCFSKSVNWEEWLIVKQDVLYKISTILEQNNLEFAFPSQSVYLSNEKEPLSVNITSN
jgi:MscS family membrane protein